MIFLTNPARLLHACICISIIFPVSFEMIAFKFSISFIGNFHFEN